MLDLLPSDIIKHLTGFVYDLQYMMEISKYIHEESKQELFKNMRKKKINRFLERKYNIDDTRIHFEFVFSRFMFITTITIPLTYVSNHTIYGTRRHWFIPMESFKRFRRIIENSNNQSLADEYMWDDSMVLINDQLTFGKISYELFI
jgi:hypothetical protein